MRLLMIYPDVDTVTAGLFHEGIGRLSAYVKQRGHEFRLLDYTRMPEPSQVVAEVREAAPDLVGFSVVTPQYAAARQILRAVRETYAGPVVFGGIHPTLQPDETLSHGDVDMVCIGEGEETLGELCDTIERRGDPSAIKSLWLNRNGSIVRNPVRPLVEELDSLPDPDRTLFANVPGFSHICAVVASRGCPYSCTYCCNHIQRGLYPNKNKYVRFMSVEKLIRQIEAARLLHPGIAFVSFNDDIMNLSMEWFRLFISEYKARIGLPFECNTRPNLMDEETADLLDEAGCMRVRIGLESGNDRVREQVLGRSMQNKDLLRAAERIRARGMQLQTYNMVGLPDERMPEMLDTVEMNARMRATVMQVSIFFPFPQTKLFKLCEEKGLLAPRPAGDFFYDYQLNRRGRIRWQVLFVHRYFGALRALFQAIWALPTPLRVPLRAIARTALAFPLFPSRSLASLYQKPWAHRLFRRAFRHYWRFYRKGMLARKEKNLTEKERGRVFRTAHDYAAELSEKVALLQGILQERDRTIQALTKLVEERSHWGQDLDKRVAELGARVIALQEEVQAKNAWALGLDKEVKELRERLKAQT